MNTQRSLGLFMDCPVLHEMATPLTGIIQPSVSEILTLKWTEVLKSTSSDEKIWAGLI